jgi:hypothetical protein
LPNRQGFSFDVHTKEQTMPQATKSRPQAVTYNAGFRAGFKDRPNNPPPRLNEYDKQRWTAGWVVGNIRRNLDR